MWCPNYREPKSSTAAREPQLGIHTEPTHTEPTIVSHGWEFTRGENTLAQWDSPGGNYKCGAQIIGSQNYREPTIVSHSWEFTRSQLGQTAAREPQCWEFTRSQLTRSQLS